MGASLEAPPELEGERKQVTVLFADVKGSMDLAEGLDAEEWARIMDRFFTILADGVRRFDGTVDKFTGDGLMALFGAPVALEDHALRACHAALHLAGTVGAYADDLRRSHAVNLHARIGLNSGEVVVGRVGGAGSAEYTAVGHTVGLAQRMEALAEPGTAYVTEHTARLVSGHFRLRDLGPFTVKGSSAALQVYALEGLGGRRRGASRWPGRSPLVGRAAEMAVLTEALTRTRTGEAQVVGVVGEAGVGKSRLCEEFTRICAAEQIAVRRAAGVSHAQGVPLLPVLELFRDNFGITDADSPLGAREKVAGRLLLLDPGFEESLPLLFDFLEVPDPERPPPQLTAEVRLRRIFDILRRLTQRRSEREALVLLLEDLHWFDGPSDAFLGELIPLYRGTRTLVVVNFRPEYQAPWMRHSYYHQLPLAPLTAGATEDLLAALLGDDPSLVPLPAQVTARTGGNPFFVEEVVRALVEDGTLAGEPGAYHLSRPLADVRVPATVQATLAARIDRLPDGEKRLLQTASVIGRTFSEAVLATVAGRRDEELGTPLRGLCEAEFLQEEATWPTAEYRFWHPLTQEVAYNTLLSDRRARLHAAVAGALTELDPARQNERAALIASHYQQAGTRLDAARWEHRAGAWEQRRDTAGAVARWRHAVELLEGLGEGEEVLRLSAEVRTQLLRNGPRTGMTPDETRALYEEVAPLAERPGDEALLCRVAVAQGAALLIRGETSAAGGAYLESAARAADLRDDGLRAVAAMCCGLTGLYIGPLPESLRWFDDVARASGGDLDSGAAYSGWSPLVHAHHFGGEALALAGRIEEGRGQVEFALRLARERSETETRAWTLCCFARLAMLSGAGAEEAGSQAAEAVVLAEESGNRLLHVLALHALGVAEHWAGRAKSAGEVLSRALTTGRTERVGLAEEASLLAHLAQAHLALGDADAARAEADEAVQVARRQGAKVMECLCLSIRAGISRALGAPDAARADIATGLAMAAEVGAATYGAFLSEELARLEGRAGALETMIARYREIGATGHVRRVEAELAGGQRDRK
ncbi:MAG: ATP-binding protein [Acidimicrobiia bacterium]